MRKGDASACPYFGRCNWNPKICFGSSRLRQVVGASALLQEATGASLDETDSHETPKGWPNLLGYKEQVIASGGGATFFYVSLIW